MEIRALLIGSRIDTRPFRADEIVAINPMVVEIPGGGRAALFRYGVVVFAGVSQEQSQAFLQRLLPLTTEARNFPGDERLQLIIDAGQREGFDGEGNLVLRDASLPRLQLLAEVLARSEVLTDDETRVGETFDKIEPLAKGLRSGERRDKQSELLSYIADSLLSQQRMVGRAEVAERPDILWESPELEGLYLQLEDEYELISRHRALERKLEVISNTAETLLDLLQTQRSLRVEWYIVILIVVEIFLTLYELFLH